MAHWGTLPNSAQPARLPGARGPDLHLVSGWRPPTASLAPLPCPLDARTEGAAQDTEEGTLLKDPESRGSS